MKELCNKWRGLEATELERHLLPFSGFFIFYFAAPAGLEPVTLLFQPPEYVGFQGVSPRPAVNSLNILSKRYWKEWP